MSEFDSSGGKGAGGKKDKGSSVWDSLRSVGRGILEGFSSGGGANAGGANAGAAVMRKADRSDPLQGERRVAAAQVKRSLKAWNDRAQGEDGDKGHDAGVEQAAPKIAAKHNSGGPRIFRAPGDPKNVPELIAKLTGKALEAVNQLRELEQENAITGMCNSARIKQSDGTLNLPAAQSAFEGRWANAPTHAARKLAKDQAFQKKIADALSSIKNSCDETDGKNRPNATIGDGTSEAALVEETKTGKPVVSQDGHYQKVPNYSDTVNKNVTLLEAEKSKITDAAKLVEIEAAILRGKERVAKMAPSIAGWAVRAATFPAIWKPDGDSKVQPGFPKVR